MTENDVENIQMPCGNFMLITNNYTIKFTLQTSKCPAADAAHNGGTCAEQLLLMILG